MATMRCCEGLWDNGSWRLFEGNGSYYILALRLKWSCIKLLYYYNIENNTENIMCHNVLITCCDITVQWRCKVFMFKERFSKYRREGQGAPITVKVPVLWYQYFILVLSHVAAGWGVGVMGKATQQSNNLMIMRRIPCGCKQCKLISELCKLITIKVTIISQYNHTEPLAQWDLMPLALSQCNYAGLSLCS